MFKKIIQSISLIIITVCLLCTLFACKPTGEGGGTGENGNAITPTEWRQLLSAANKGLVVNGSIGIELKDIKNESKYNGDLMQYIKESSVRESLRYNATSNTVNYTVDTGSRTETKEETSQRASVHKETSILNGDKYTMFQYDKEEDNSEVFTSYFINAEHSKRPMSKYISMAKEVLDNLWAIDVTAKENSVTKEATEDGNTKLSLNVGNEYNNYKLEVLYGAEKLLNVTIITIVKTIKDTTVYKGEQTVSCDFVYSTEPYQEFTIFGGIATYKHTTPTISIAFIGANGISGVFGDAIMLPNDPISEGKRFMGWFCDKECTIPFTAKTFPSYDISVYPLFQKAA